MTTRLLFHRTAAAASLILSFALTVSFLPVEVRAANAKVEIVKPADGAVLT
jgi:hypothetical protein